MWSFQACEELSHVAENAKLLQRQLQETLLDKQVLFNEFLIIKWEFRQEMRLMQLNEHNGKWKLLSLRCS